MKVLVTGGAGFLGSHLVDALVSRGEKVIVVDNLRRGSLQNLQKHLASKAITFQKLDIRDYADLLHIMSGAELIYHLAAQSNVMGAVTDPDYSFSTNVMGTFNVLKAASALKVRRVIFASSREVYGDSDHLPAAENTPLKPKNLYGASKVAGEAYCQSWEKVGGIDCFILRFANLYGPRDRDRVIPLWLDLARRGGDLELYGGQQVLDFLWIEYAVKALLICSQCNNAGPVNVGSGTGVSLGALAERILAITGRRSKLHYLPSRNIETVRFIADITRMRNVLGVEPPEDSLKEITTLAGNEQDY